MKRMLLTLAFLILSGCTYETEHGRCVGAFDEKDPALTYRLSVGNVFWGIVGFELLYPPIKVVADATFCPVARVPKVEFPWSQQLPEGVIVLPR